MNASIFKDAMVAMPMSQEASSSGIMSGMSFDEGEDQMPERSVRDPEILMNNLRGDMRSVDARYMELAQMVGEQAAMETPEEVLALIQSQLAMQQAPAGIGGLPGAPTPDQLPGGAPAAPPAPAPGPMGQGPAPMPPGGGGGVAPFSQPGETPAPPTPDGLPPVYAAGGQFITNAARGLRDFFLMGADEASTAVKNIPDTARAADAAAGRMLLTPQPTMPRIENARGAGGRFTKEQYVPDEAMDLRYPTLSEGVSQGLRDAVGKYDPRAGAAVAGPASIAAIMQAGDYLNGDPTKSSQPSSWIDVNGVPVEVDPYWGALGPRGMPMEPLAEMPTTKAGSLDMVPPADMDAAAKTPKTAAEMLKAATSDVPLTSPTEDMLVGMQRDAESGKTMADRIKAMAEVAKPKSRAERTKEAYEGLSALYKDVLGDGAQDRKTQALLLLAEAGFKFAGNAKPTMAMALADSLSGVTKGMSALAAQKSERDMKMKLLALQGATEQVAAEDKAAQARALQRAKSLGEMWKIMQKGAQDRQTEYLKADLKSLEGGGNVFKDAGVGLRTVETDKGSFVGFRVDPNDPSVRSAINSPLTNNEANPFVQNAGPADSSMVTDKAERVTIQKRANKLATMAGDVNRLVTSIGSVYGPGAFLSNFANNVIVPVTPFNPDLATAENVTKVNNLLQKLRSALAAAASGDSKLSNQEQEWVSTYLPADAAALFADPEANLKKMQTLATILRNERSVALNQLGFQSDNLVMDVPPLGTQNDPFVWPSDEQGQAVMSGFLANSFENLSNKDATVYVKMPNGSVQPFKASSFARQGAE